MKEKELRFALVCFGGVSLAIYMHGINKEILKLVRASRALHGIRDRAERSRDPRRVLAHEKLAIARVKGEVNPLSSSTPGKADGEKNEPKK